jgi:hypothetical protein
MRILPPFGRAREDIRPVRALLLFRTVDVCCALLRTRFCHRMMRARTGLVPTNFQIVEATNTGGMKQRGFLC